MLMIVHHAFRQLAEMHYERLYRAAYAVTMDEGDASDVVQDAFLKAWRGLGKFRGDSSVTTWLTRIAINSARDHLRRNKARTLSLVAREILFPVVQDASQEIEDRDALCRALCHLSPAARQVVALRYGLDLPIKEIALTLECPEGTVKSRLSTALEMLRTWTAPLRPDHQVSQLLPTSR